MAPGLAGGAAGDARAQPVESVPGVARRDGRRAGQRDRPPVAAGPRRRGQEGRPRRDVPGRAARDHPRPERRRREAGRRAPVRGCRRGRAGGPGREGGRPRRRHPQARVAAADGRAARGGRGRGDPADRTPRSGPGGGRRSRRAARDSRPRPAGERRARAGGGPHPGRRDRRVHHDDRPVHGRLDLRRARTHRCGRGEGVAGRRGAARPHPGPEPPRRQGDRHRVARPRPDRRHRGRRGDRDGGGRQLRRPGGAWRGPSCGSCSATRCTP